MEMIPLHLGRRVTLMTRQDSLQRLLYASLAMDYPWPHTVLDIARIAERRNATAGVNGCLFFSHTHYLQVLEGAETALAPLWASILRDRRHRVLWQGAWPLTARRIRDLPMGYVDVVREPGAAADAAARAERLGPRDSTAACAAVLEAVAARFPSRWLPDRVTATTG